LYANSQPTRAKTTRLGDGAEQNLNVYGPNLEPLAVSTRSEP
jgi:hypothetical protein